MDFFFNCTSVFSNIKEKGVKKGTGVSMDILPKVTMGGA